MRRVTALALSTALTAIAATAVATPADAAALSSPSGVHASTSTSSSFTVALNRASGATAYRVYAATTKAALYVGHITSHTKHATSSRPTVTVGGFHYTSAVLWYRVETLSKSSHRWDSTPRTAGLTPPRPTGFAGHVTATGSYLTWTRESVGTGFVIAEATNAAMTQNRVDRFVKAGNAVYSPYGLARGTTYYFQIAAYNGPAGSAYSPQVSLTPRTSQDTIKAVTYNLLEDQFDGTPEGGNIVAPWSQRAPIAAALLMSASPDLIAVQEAADWVGQPQGRGGKRMVDTLVAHMPGYALARTEVPPSEAGYMRTGQYIIYKRSTMTPIGTGGHWQVGTSAHSTYTAYQLFRIPSGAQMLFTSSHLFTGNGLSGDNIRRGQTEALVNDARSVAGSRPIVFGGDFNSNDYTREHPYNAPVQVMENVNYVDTQRVAITRYNAAYNSANQYMRSPAMGGYYIDYLFTTPGTSVNSWGLLMNMSHGKLVGVIPSDHNPTWSTIAIAS